MTFFVCFLFFLFSISSLDAEVAQQVPIIYRSEYNISVWGIEKFHPFDTNKYGGVYGHLLANSGLSPEQFYVPNIVSQKDLELVHTTKYLNSLNSSKTVARIAEVSMLRFIPNSVLQRNLLIPMKYATGGTILGAKLALKYGWAINLSGGYHHAKSESGGGFCFFADIPIAMYKLWEEHKDLKVFIIDLDAHQGNGHEAVLRSEKRVAILDIYNRYIYPKDNEVKKYITYDVPVSSNIEDKQYLSLLSASLSNAFKNELPGLIIYNAGTDVFKGDSLGGMKLSEAGIIKRDEIVFKIAKQYKVPILMLLSGGYSKESAGIVGKSIENLLRRVLNNYSY